MLTKAQLFAWLRWSAIVPFILLIVLAIIFEIVTSVVIIFFGVALVLGLWREAKIRRAATGLDQGDATQGRIWERLELEGFWTMAILVVGVGVGVFWRFARPTYGGLFALAFLGLGATIFRFLWTRREVTVTMTKIVANLMFVPLAWAWIVVSTTHAIWVGTHFLVTRGHDHSGFDNVRGARVQALQSWRAAGRPLVTVTLSGGGYRAAVTHSGVLWVLDSARIPIETLSAVSGGSIVGAAYVLGWTPEGFARRLCDRKPGLPNYLFNVFLFALQTETPLWGSGDTYQLHFYLEYFHRHSLAETQTPTLVVNVTEYETGDRVAFWPGHDAGVGLARLVAASGAFPVAFEPVWIGNKRYMDGGVVENLGIGGLLQYLNGIEPVQRLLVISDVSAQLKPVTTWQKPSIIQVATHSTNISYRQLHERIYELYRKENSSLWPGGIAPVEIVALRPTWPGQAWVFEEGQKDSNQSARDKEIAAAVANLDTLQELSPDEVQKAFYVGARVAEKHLGTICLALDLSPCPTVNVSKAARICHQ